MLAFLSVTLLFAVFKLLQLDMVEEFLNQKLPLSIMVLLLWGIALYVTFSRNAIRERSISIARVYIKLFLIAHTMSLLYVLMQSNLNFLETISWIYRHIGHFTLSLVLIYVVYIFMYNVLGKLFLSVVLTSCSFAIVAVVNYYKLIFRGDPLYPSDFTQIGHMQSVIPMVMDYFSLKYILVGIGCIGGCIVVLMYLRKHIVTVKIHLGVRVLLILGSICILYGYANYTNTFMNKLFQKWDVNFILWDQNGNYAENGLVLGFISNLDTTVAEKPKEYSKDNIVQIANNIKKQYKSQTVNEKQAEKPNVIFIMSEAFWDPIKLTNLSFSEDPVSNLHHYIENFPGGQTISPTFGGNTANTEFEALTSYSMSFLKPGSIPYQQVVTNQNSIPSIVSELKNDGYQAKAIHAFGRTFFKRDNVYDTLGFDNFNAQDTMKNTDIDGDYISDLSMSKEIIDELNKAKKPTFIHAVTMQNHFPFTPGKFGETKIKISGLTEDSAAELETYTEGLRRSDEALQYLIEQINDLDRPTLLVFFGDHLPSLGVNKSIYKEAGYIKNEKTINERLAMAETPLLIYGNYNLPNDNLGMVSPIYFSNLVFDYAGINKSPFYQFLSELHKEVPVLRDELKVNGKGEVIENLTDKQKEMLKQYELIQYDLLVGKQYSKDILFS